MRNEFVSYEIALALKQLGFDKLCFGRIYADGGIELLPYLYKNSDQIGEVTSCSAPLYQQVFRWFREKYGVYTRPEKFDEKTWWVEWGDWNSSICKTYEEAENEWLLKLIEIVKAMEKENIKVVDNDDERCVWINKILVNYWKLTQEEDNLIKKIADRF